jgi:ABC-type branched-subunit amino acid transport system permease subunit
MTMRIEPMPRSQSWGLALLHNLWVPAMLVGIIYVGRELEFAPKPGAYVMNIAMMAGINIILAVSLQLINGVSGQFSLGHAGFMAVGAYIGGFATYTFGPWNYDPNADNPDPRQLFANPGSTLIFFIALGIAAAIACAVVLGLFLLVRETRRISKWVPRILSVALFVWVVVDARRAYAADVIPAGCVWSRGAVGLIHLYEAIVSHGQGAGLWLTNLMPVGWRKPATLLVALFGGGLSAAAAGLVVGVPTLRLRGDYLAIATLGFAEIIRNVIVTIPALGAATGLSINPYWNAPDPNFDTFYMSPWIFGTAALTFVCISRLVRSPKGNAIKSVRDDEIAAAAMGINPTEHRVMAFVIGAFFAGVAGVLYVHYNVYLNANSYGFMRSIEIVVMVTLGGMESLWGAAIAAVALTVIPELLDNADKVFPKALTPQALWMAQNRWVLYAVLLLVIMIARAKLKGVFRSVVRR